MQIVHRSVNTKCTRIRPIYGHSRLNATTTFDRFCRDRLSTRAPRHSETPETWGGHPLWVRSAMLAAMIFMRRQMVRISPNNSRASANAEYNVSERSPNKKSVQARNLQRALAMSGSSVGLVRSPPLSNHRSNQRGAHQ